MAALPVCDLISLPATLNQINWVVIVADRDYFLLEADVAPGGGSGGNISALFGKLSGLDRLPGVAGLSIPNGVPVGFTTTNKTFPSEFSDIWIGNRANAPPLVTVAAAINQEFKNLPGAIPLVRPPVIKRGEVLIVAAMNLTSNAQTMQWNLSATPATSYAQDLAIINPNTEGPQAVDSRQ
jgi:hypothetical protein